MLAGRAREKTMSYRYRVVTVFGGNGFIGRHLVRRLARTGAIVRVATRHPSTSTFLKTNGVVGQVVPIAVDLTNDDSVAMAMADADAVVNLVGILNESSRYRFQNIHVDAADRIARMAAKTGITRLIHISALGADADSSSQYARSKAAGELAVRQEFREATILRPGLVFGPDDDFFNRFAGLTRVTAALPLFGCRFVGLMQIRPMEIPFVGGETRFQPIYVGDVADAIMAALGNDASKGKTYELGGPRVYSFKELMELLLSVTDRSRWLLPLPWGVAAFAGSILEKVPFFKPLLTRDQVEMLKHDTVVSAEAPCLKDLGVSPTPAEAILPTYLARFRPGGRHGQLHIVS